MLVPLKEIMMKLAVGYELAPYETCPWMMYEDDQQITCSAEVRMGPGASDIEAEIQFVMDDDAPYNEEEEEDDEGDTGGRTGSVASGLALGPGEELPEEEKPKEPSFPPLRPGTTQQIFYMLIIPSADQWKPVKLVIKGKDYVNKIGAWEEKGCELFSSCVQSIQMNELPDIDDLIESKMVDEDSRGGRRGRIGRKSPKVKPAALMGMKQGGM